MILYKCILHHALWYRQAVGLKLENDKMRINYNTQSRNVTISLSVI
jgi:hypothetical protein